MKTVQKKFTEKDLFYNRFPRAESTNGWPKRPWVTINSCRKWLGVLKGAHLRLVALGG